jgi:hypothetical protein
MVVDPCTRLASAEMHSMQCSDRHVASTSLNGVFIGQDADGIHFMQGEELERLQAQASHAHAAARAARQQALDAQGAATAAREAAKRAGAEQQQAQAELAELRCRT